MIAGLLIKKDVGTPASYGFASVVGVLSSLTVLVLVGTLFSAPIDPVYQLPMDAYLLADESAVLALLPILMWPLTGLLWILIVTAWAKGSWARSVRVHYGVFTLAFTGLITMLNYWNIF